MDPGAVSATKSQTYINNGFEPELTRDKTADTTKDAGVASSGRNGNEQAMYDEVSSAQRREANMADLTRPAPRKSLTGSRSRSGSDGGPYRGMGKEELLRFSNQTFWRNLRYVCMTVVLTGWLALLITLVAIVLTYPHCKVSEPRDWWQKTVIYRIYVPSFLDRDGDGIGDLEGVRSKLDYLKDLGVDTIALSPIYTLGSKDTQDWPSLTDTHIVNHTDIDPKYGTMAEFQSLVDEIHEKDMHVTLDFIPNHTSDDHPWFRESSANESSLYRSYYVWALGSGANQPDPPNNWQSKYNCSAWEKGSNDTMFFLHQFMVSQPDLNLRSQKVKDELEAILKFWLDLGVDGFYIRDSNFLFEDYDLRDDELMDVNDTSAVCKGVLAASPSYEAYDHQNTQGLSEIFDMLARWRTYLDDYGEQTGQYKILLADVDGSYQNVMDYYGLFNRDGVDFPLNKFSLDLDQATTGDQVAKMVGDWMSNMPSDRWPNWMGGDDRSVRLVDRLGEQIAEPYLMLMMLLPGTPYFYYGDEIGLRAFSEAGATTTSMTTISTSITPPTTLTSPISDRQALSMRGPMQWTNDSLAGFTYGSEPWMLPNPDYAAGVNVEEKMGEPESLWNLFRNLTQLRHGKPSFEYGDFVLLEEDDQIYSFVREFDGEKGYLIALNFDHEVATKSLYGLHETVPEAAYVEIVCGADAIHQKGGSAGLDPISLMPYEGIVVSWDYKAKEI